VAYATGVEIERQFKHTKTPTDIKVQSGTVHPVTGLETELREETPGIREGEIEVPAWATESTSHHWVEVTVVGHRKSYLVDAMAPPQFTTSPTPKPILLAIGEGEQRLSQYESDSGSPTALSTATYSELELPWPITTQTFPFGQSSRDALPADGGISTTNTVIQASAREGLEEMPTNSVDVICCSPPYRLQCAYPEAMTEWDTDPRCDHTWVEKKKLNTETPVDMLSGAGLSGTRSKEEQREARNRSSIRCEDCGGWKGQLGLEPTVEMFIRHLTEVFQEAKRVLKPDGSLFVNIADSFDAKQTVVKEQRNEPQYDARPKSLVGVPSRLQISMIEAGWICRENLIWNKPNPAPEPVTERATKSYEHVFRFVQQRDYQTTSNGPEYNILEIETSSTGSTNTAPMPKELPETLIESALARDDNGVVLDTFAGSGTVLAAAADLGHSYVGFEINSETAATARERLSKYNVQPESLTGQVSLNTF
jgi:DNA modification methylase